MKAGVILLLISYPLFLINFVLFTVSFLSCIGSSMYKLESKVVRLDSCLTFLLIFVLHLSSQQLLALYIN